MAVLRGVRVALRAVVEGDLARLREILGEPGVARWGFELGDEELLGIETDDDLAMSAFAIELAGRVVGWIGGWEKNHPEYRHAGIDLFLADDAQGKGLRPEAIRLVCRYLFDERGHHRITIDPAAANEHAIRAYEKVGFRRVGVLRQYERGPDGSYHDGVLLDMLRADLRDD
ncbi:MAG: GNAT family N-acetyltransferase [Labilithrix sp.]|nr:GNAT family N-acetyltransferase [Labilithrix sp.]MCW5816442.1 GNAT family N-acetyltransferase [Labilithrix sp.]